MSIEIKSQITEADFPPVDRGLTAQLVRERQAAGLSNVAKSRVSRSYFQIIWSNLFTLFNAILLVCIAVTLYYGSPKDTVFGIVLVVNAATGIISEVKAKRMLDRMSILDKSPILVLRDGKVESLPPHEIVVGDIIQLKLGDQVPVDGVVLDSSGLRLNEANLTGESVPQFKDEGDSVLSGSAVVSGGARMVATAVGPVSWANRMGEQVKKFSMARSELAEGINLILRLITWALPVVILLLVWAQVRVFGGWDAFWGDHFGLAVVAIVAAIVGMIPQGLVLLTSVNFATSAMKLARRGVLVQELPAVEVLARVDALCLDKTGTLTTGAIKPRGFARLDSKNLFTASELSDRELQVLSLLVEDRGNATAEAIWEGIESESSRVPDLSAQLVPFDSSRKWAAVLADGESWVMGAPEIVLGLSTDSSEPAARLVNAFAAEGARVITLAVAKVGTTPVVQDAQPQLPPNLQPQLFIVLAEEIRPDARDTLDYFRSQAVDVFIISGDNPATVAALARRAGLNETGFDCRNLPTGEAAVREVIRKERVFGRVTPEQKRALVGALQTEGKTVAMTGDGVNDALALKDSDLGIAMGNAAGATKAASKLVLLKSQFGALPAVLAEGRRVLGNMERVSTLFLSKTVYALVLALAVGAFGLSYPFLPRHLTLIGSTSIGIPAFILALAPSHAKYRPGFLHRVAALVIPAGIICASCSILAYVWAGGGESKGQASSIATIVLAGLAMILLAILAQPLLSWRGFLVVAMVLLLLSAVFIRPVREFFALVWPTAGGWMVILSFFMIGALLLLIVGLIWEKRVWKPGKLR